jgi:molecular chaperone GrpE
MNDQDKETTMNGASEAETRHTGASSPETDETLLPEGERMEGNGPSPLDGEDPSSRGAESGKGESNSPEQAEVDILRTELARLQDELKNSRQQADEMRDRYLRARADLENYRRRSAQELERAREAGLDSALLPILMVYDDLGRALEVSTDDPSTLIPGIESVRSSLKRNLESLGIKEVGARGESFDPDLHEALTTVPTEDRGLAGTIAEVYQTGFMKEERLVRPARVVVYQN